ncbi:MAG: anti-sigma factor [Herpetosiphonaceae bacterium]|nr:anti-sigma factor [Herpetosiphonaceae bacterium]
MADTSLNPLEELIDLYALGALEPDEMALVEEHLAQSPRARAMLEQSKQVVSALAWSPEQHDPPAGAYERFRQRVAPASAQPQAAPRLAMAPAAVPAPTFGQRLRQLFAPQQRWGTAFAALLLVIALGVGGWNLSLQRQVSDLTASASEYRALTALLSEPATRLVALTGADGPAQTARTQLLINPERHEAYLVTAGLPALPANQSYQLWMIADGQPLSMGVFALDAQGNATVQMANLPPAGSQNLFGITIEPAGGSDQPTSAPILLGEL